MPADLVQASCYAFLPAEDGNCATADGQFIETARGNFGGYYPNGFYWVMGLFAGQHLPSAVVGMRLLNSAMYALGLAALLRCAAPGRRESYMLGSLVTLVPLGLFTVASVNPSSWAITSATLVWASLVEFVRAENTLNRWVLGPLIAIALAMGVGARADSAAYAALAVALAWVVTARFTRRSLVSGSVVAGVGLIAAVWAFSLGSATGVLGELKLRPEDYAGGWLQRWQDVAALYAGMFGTRGLGWLDTSVRSATWVLAGGAFAAVVFWSLRRCRWRKAVAILVVVGLGTIAPVVLTTLRNSWIAESLQPRYFLPLLVMGAMIALAEDNTDGPQLGWAQAAILVTTLGVAQANALHTNLRRYITGIDGKWFNLDSGIQWWWSAAPSPMVVFGLGSIAFTAAIFVAVFDPTPRYVPVRAFHDVGAVAPTVPRP